MMKSINKYVLNIANKILFGACLCMVSLTPMEFLEAQDLELRGSSWSWESEPFTAVVLPRSAQKAMVGQKCVFLISAQNMFPSRNRIPFQLTFDIKGSNRDIDVSINQTEIRAGEVAEIQMIPRSFPGGDAGGMLPDPIIGESSSMYTVEVTVQRGEVVKTETLQLHMFLDGKIEEPENPSPADYRTLMLEQLMAHYPEFGIDPYLRNWDGGIVCTDKWIVTHYVCYNDLWEVGIRWHNMSAPDDWAEMYLRRRGIDINPIFAFKIDSLDQLTPLHPIVVPQEGIWR